MDIHSHFIRDMKQETGKSMRELEWEWKKAERQVDIDRMTDPDKYTHLKKTDGTLAQEVARRFKDNVTGGETEEKVDEETDQLSTEMANGIEDDIDLGLEMEPTTDTKQPEEPEFDLDAFMEEPETKPAI